MVVHHRQERRGVRIGGNIDVAETFEIANRRSRHPPIGVSAGSPCKFAVGMRQWLKRMDGPFISGGPQQRTELAHVCTDIQNHINIKMVGASRETMVDGIPIDIQIRFAERSPRYQFERLSCCDRIQASPLSVLAVRFVDRVGRRASASSIQCTGTVAASEM
jgi:hypothetical protein